VPHGEWESWIENSCKISARAAQTWMKLAKELDRSVNYTSIRRPEGDHQVARSGPVDRGRVRRGQARTKSAARCAFAVVGDRGRFTEFAPAPAAPTIQDEILMHARGIAELVDMNEAASRDAVEFEVERANTPLASGVGCRAEGTGLAVHRGRRSDRVHQRSGSNFRTAQRPARAVCLTTLGSPTST
jgi:hypothetical protein